MGFCCIDWLSSEMIHVELPCSMSVWHWWLAGSAVVTAFLNGAVFSSRFTCSMSVHPCTHVFGSLTLEDHPLPRSTPAYLTVLYKSTMHLYIIPFAHDATELPQSCHRSRTERGSNQGSNISIIVYWPYRIVTNNHAFLCLPCS